MASLPANLTAAAVVLLTFGALAGLGTALTLLAALLAGARRFTFYGDPGMMGGHWAGDGGPAGWVGFLFVALLAALGAAITGGHVLAGWAILQRRSWGRILGLVVSGTALVVLVVGLLSTLVWAVVGMPTMGDLGGGMGDYYRYYDSMMGATVAIGTIVSLGLIAGYGFVLWVLARHGDALE